MASFLVRRSAAWKMVLLALAAAGCGDDPVDPGGPVVTTSVTIGPGNAFNPPAIRVSPGAMVTWTWSETVSHNINFADASITDLASQNTGTYSTAMPTTPGTYTYQCNFHSGMAGSVQVQ